MATRQAQLSADQIARAALAWVDERGLGSLSMRALASELGVGTMSLYHYFRTKQELLDAVIDVAFATEPPPALRGSWREQIRALAHAARDALSRHPAVVQIRVMQPVLRPDALRMGEAGLTILEAAGFPRDEAAKGFRLLFTYTVGFAAFSPRAAEQAAREAAASAIERLPEEFFPHLRAAAEEASSAMAGDEVFDYGLERILDGFEVRLAQLNTR